MIENHQHGALSLILSSIGLNGYLIPFERVLTISK